MLKSVFAREDHLAGGTVLMEDIEIQNGTESNRHRRRRILKLVAVIAIVAVILLVGRRDRTSIGKDEIGPENTPENMVFVPSGHFLIGSDDAVAEYDERPMRTAYVNAFYIDRYEVTQAEYRSFQPNHSVVRGRENYPVTGVTRDEAEACCRFFGKRLPTGSEWEKAARGTDGRRFPWGNSFTGNPANSRVPGVTPQLMPVGSFPNGVTPYGAFDMAGNAWEWVTDEIVVRSSFWRSEPAIVRAIVRGGACRYSPFHARTSHQGFEDPKLTCNDIGFRCAKDIK